MCGKNDVIDGTELIKPGSPPHVREKPEATPRINGSIGITPACAGKTLPFFLKLRLRQDYPRVCGKDY